MPDTPPKKWLLVTLKVGVYALFQLLCLIFFGQLLMPLGGYLVAAGISVFLAAAVGNSLAMRIYERGRLADIGLTWNPASVRNLVVGLAGGAGAASLVLGGPLLLGVAELQTIPNGDAHWRTFLFVSMILLFGAAGEEMFFRGYGFQVLLRILGPFATILPVSALFALAHAENQHVSTLGLVNTMGWGILLGYAFLLSGDLWLPIGLHFGWNWTLPLFGVNLSGFTMTMTGYAMHWKTGPLWSGGEYGPEAGILTCGILFVLFFYLRKAPIRPQTPFLLRPLPEE